MMTLIECFAIFCTLAYKYWFVFIPVMISLTILEIAEEIN